MFGYIIPDKNNMYIKDFNVFKSFYCGLCKTLSKMGSEVSRLCTNYDMTFYSVLVHSLKNEEVKFEKKRCFYNGKKQVVVIDDPLSRIVADIAVLYVYYNAEDDIQDGKKSRWFVKNAIECRKKAAAKRLPKIDSMMKEQFSKLYKLEKEKCSSIDQVADCFAALMRDITKEVVETNYTIDTFTYNLGRLVYLMDAVDDVEKDTKENRFNPLILNYGECDNKSEYLKKNEEELRFVLYSTYNKLVGAYNEMNITLAEGVLSNTVYLGIKMQMDRILNGEEKCQITRL